MAKDPAILWYWNDWRGGTVTMSRFLKGCYIDLLDAQFNSGHLSLDQVKTVLGSDFFQSWPSLKSKFVLDNDGLVFNERLETEILRRRAYSLSRSNNRKKNKTHELSHDIHMENENGNEIVNGNKEGGMGEELKTHDSGLLTDFEKWCTDNFYHLEQMMVRMHCDEPFMRERLHLFHLHLVEGSRYPITKQAAMAGFEKYIIHSLNKQKQNKIPDTPDRKIGRNTPDEINRYLRGKMNENGEL